MDEPSALAVVAVRALESGEAERPSWGDADRAWASRAAAEVVGSNATPDAFLARRAALALERVGERGGALPRAVRALAWRPWVATAIVGFAFALGVFVDQVDASQRVNILAPPVLGLILWNLGVYAAIMIGYVVRYGEPSRPGFLRRLVVRLAGGKLLSRIASGPRDAVVALAEDWAVRAGPLYATRAARILHLGAAALAAGILVGLYVRGLAFEYRASWESTFLGPPVVRTIASAFYSAGTAVTGIPVPSVERIASIRAPAGENAASWLHLIAATVVAVVIVPRLLFALVAGIVERYRSTHVPLGLDEPYFQRLMRGYRGGPARVRVYPYSYAVPAAAATGLEAIVARSFGGSAALVVATTAAYGGHDPASAQADVAGATLVALFNATASPERETHGAFLAALARRRDEAEAVIALVDESAWAARFADDAARVADRRAAWKTVCDEARVPVVFADLARPDLAATDAALDAAIGDKNP